MKIKEDVAFLLGCFFSSVVNEEKNIEFYSKSEETISLVENNLKAFELNFENIKKGYQDILVIKNDDNLSKFFNLFKIEKEDLLSLKERNIKNYCFLNKNSYKSFVLGYLESNCIPTRNDKFIYINLYSDILDDKFKAILNEFFCESPSISEIKIISGKKYNLFSYELNEKNINILKKNKFIKYSELYKYIRFAENEGLL